MDTTTN